MAHLIIVAHAPVASALMALGRHAYPECADRMSCIDVLPEDGIEAAAERIRLALQPLAGADALLLVDVFGATPCNAAVAVADGVRTRIVAGVNAPMLWRTLCYANRPLSDLVDRAILGGQQGVMHVAVARRLNQNPPPAAHDQVQHHHQQ
jgi:mannose PTS system EIIA component